MKRGLTSQGYTIIEVMLFLVITGVLLSTALFVFNGRQQRTQFTQGVREVDAQIRTIINETASGYYPNKGDISCYSDNGEGPQLEDGESEQGENTGCIFLGRVLQFTPGKDYRAYTVVGQQRGANGQEVTKLSGSSNINDPNSARQTLITPTNTQDLPDATESFTLPWGITVTQVITPPDNQSVGAVGLILSLGAYTADGNDLISGTTGLSTIPLIGTGLDSDPQTIINETRNMADDPKNPGRIVICLRSGGGNRRAAILLGGNNSNLSTEVVIDDVPEECPDV